MKLPKFLLRALHAASRSTAGWTQSQLGFGSGYNVTNPLRQILGRRRPTQATANELLTSSLPTLRAYCRQLDRNNPAARAALDGITALVVGQGISLEIECGDDKTNSLLREVWQEWLAHCCVDGRDLYALQSEGMREVACAGELLWRLVMPPERQKDGQIPLAVLPLESEWLDERTGGGLLRNADGSMNVGPVTIDLYGRPLKYRLRPPEMTMAGLTEELSAADIVHVFERRRAMQARGEPWMAPVVETFQQERDLVDAELQSAITSSSIGIAITSAYHDKLDSGGSEDDGTQNTADGRTDDPAQSLKLGAVARLFPGETITPFSHTKPSQQIKPFREMLRGDIAGALRLPQRFLDRDVSRANYSSMRADMLDTERLLAPVREWFGHGTSGRLFRAVLPYLAVRAGVKLPKKVDYRLLPDGQPYVDPQKDAEAAITAIIGGLSTYEAEIAKRGGDYLKVWEQKKREEEQSKKLGLTFIAPGKQTGTPDTAAIAGQAKPAESTTDDVAK